MIDYFKLAALFLFVLCSCDTKTDIEKDVVKVGDILPTFTVYDNRGNIVHSDECIGNTTIIAFVHTSCSDCRKALPILQKTYEQAGMINWLVISREEEESEMTEYWRKNNLTLPYYPQNDTHIYNLFAYYNIPRIYIIDKYGIIRYSFSDDHIPEVPELLDHIEALK